MDRATRRAYEARAAAWIGARRPRVRARARVRALVDAAATGAWIADIGCGPGWYARSVVRAGRKPVALDLSRAMLSEVPDQAPGARPLLADAAALPIARAALGGAFAINSLQHLPFDELGAALAGLHDAIATNGLLAITLVNLARIEPTASEQKRRWARRRFADDRFGRRLFTAVDETLARDLAEAAGFSAIRVDSPHGLWTWVRAVRAHTLPDYVAPKLRLLVCGLNPSVRAAETGVPFGRPGNRFWPAAVAAGLVSRPYEPFAALREGIGFTDLAKRTTRRSSELSDREYADGLARVEATVRLYRPAAVCFVGLEGWRRAVDRTARPGWLRRRCGGRPSYLMPSTSGLNAHATPAALAEHLRVAADPRGRRPSGGR